MSRDKIYHTKASSDAAARLKKAMLAYHDFRKEQVSHNLSQQLIQLTNWQSERLKQTHQDLYQSPGYTLGLQFLLSDLYSAKDFSDRDRDLERIFPKIIKLLPKSIVDTVGLLVELNLLTKTLDYQLTQTIFEKLNHSVVDEQNYCDGYRHCNNQVQRNHQIQLISEVGKKLDRYARSSVINFSLKITEAPAEMAGLEALHSFIMQGFSAFHSMENVSLMMQTLVQRETQILDNIFQYRKRPFDLNPNTPQKRS